MEWIDHLNQAIDYLEEHISEEISYEEAARIAGCSAYHFQRMFTYLAGAPLSEYIRRRRMSLAAVDLRSGDEKIIDIALKYGYSSPTAFNRAFQGVHGVSPSAARKGGCSLKSYPPIRFKIIIKGVEEMNYRIEERGPIRILGVSQPLHRDMEQNFSIVPEMWGRAAQDGTIPRLAAIMDGQPMGLLGVCAGGSAEQWRYFIAVASSAPAGEGLEEYLIPACTWAVFPGAGTNLAIQELERRVITEWLPTSGYEYADAPDIEVYLNPDPENARFEVWIPVVKSGK